MIVTVSWGGPSWQAGAKQCAVETFAGLTLENSQVVSAERDPGAIVASARECDPREGIPDQLSRCGFPIPGTERSSRRKRRLQQCAELSRHDLGAPRKVYAAVGGDTGHQTATSGRICCGASITRSASSIGARGPCMPSPGRRRNGSSPRSWDDVAQPGLLLRLLDRRSTRVTRRSNDIRQTSTAFIAGAPGNNRVRLNAGFLWQFLANRQRGERSASDHPGVQTAGESTAAVVAACDARDGVADGIVDDPRTCDFEILLQCNAERPTSPPASPWNR
jgi:hypothetical protein